MTVLPKFTTALQVSGKAQHCRQPEPAQEAALVTVSDEISEMKQQNSQFRMNFFPKLTFLVSSQAFRETLLHFPRR